MKPDLIVTTTGRRNKNNQDAKAAVSLADVAEGVGILEDLFSELTRRCAMLRIAIDSPRLGERRYKWHGEEMKDFVFSDRTNTMDSGESSLLDQMGDEMWKRFRKKARPPKPRRPRDGVRRGK
jgi:hypothetical protein